MDLDKSTKWDAVTKMGIYIGDNGKNLSYFPLRRPKPETDESDLVFLVFALWSKLYDL